MKERPILFSTEMVKAILDGRKSQTRRVIKPQPEYQDYMNKPSLHWNQCGGRSLEEIALYCPYGKPGERLWVRERINKHGDGNAPYTCTYDADLSPVTATCHVMWCGRSTWEWGDKRNVLPSIFMPRWASRITLEIVNVRVERVRDISFEDCLSEGCSDKYEHYDANCKHEVNGECCQGWHYGQKWNFYYLWNSINAKRGYGWDVNPWVWVVEFRRVA